MTLYLRHQLTLTVIKEKIKMRAGNRKRNPCTRRVLSLLPKGGELEL
jgi:hypothetical protein